MNEMFCILLYLLSYSSELMITKFSKEKLNVDGSSEWNAKRTLQRDMEQKVTELSE